jgi:hypothetical protein
LLVQHTPRRPSGAHRRPTKRHTCACPHAIRRSPFGIPLIPLRAGGPQEAISPRPRRILAARFECTIPNGRATLPHLPPPTLPPLTARSPRRRGPRRRSPPLRAI